VKYFTARQIVCDSREFLQELTILKKITRIGKARRAAYLCREYRPSQFPCNSGSCFSAS